MDQMLTVLLDTLKGATDAGLYAFIAYLTYLVLTMGIKVIVPCYTLLKIIDKVFKSEKDK